MTLINGYGWKRVTLEEYAKSRGKSQFEIVEEWEGIELPKRATEGSAGYDFHTPIPLKFPEDNGKVISLGVRVKLPQNSVLLIMPRSGLGFKYNMRLANTIGVIDSDYFYSDNEGHIKVKLLCDKTCILEAGERICQGIITTYDTFADDKEVKTKRNGGFGSTKN